jgi:hypothetical protein
MSSSVTATLPPFGASTVSGAFSMKITFFLAEEISVDGGVSNTASSP